MVALPGGPQKRMRALIGEGTVPLRLPTLDETASELDYLRAVATSVLRAAGARILGQKALDSARAWSRT